jgi:Dihydrodipicolinate synthase/N-acetylneuraminate lyase
MIEIKGIIPAMATPFHEDESINEQELRNSIDRHIKAGVNGVFCLGTNGENYAMDFEEKLRTMEITVEHTAGRVLVYAGTGATTTKETIALSKKAQEIGADACSIICPWFAENTQEGLYEHYKAVAAVVDLPLVVYNMPARTGVNVDYKTMARLANIENIMGAKDSIVKRMAYLLGYNLGPARAPFNLQNDKLDATLKADNSIG